MVKAMKMPSHVKSLNFQVAPALLWLSLSFALSLFASARTLAQEAGAAAPEASHGEGVGSLKERLNLTPEQLQQIRDIRSQSETEGRALGRRVNVARRALDEAIYADQSDDALIEKRTQELVEAVGAATRLRAQVELRIRRVLTAEQLGTLRELRQRARRERIENRREGGPRSPRPRRDAFSERPDRRPDASAPARRPLQRLRRRDILPKP